MAETVIQHAITRVAAADLSALQYHIMRGIDGGTTNNASLATASSMIGILHNKPQSGEFATIVRLGRCPVVAGAAISATETWLTTNSSGRATSAQSGDYVFGKNAEVAAADGDIVTCEIVPPFRLFGAA